MIWYSTKFTKTQVPRTSTVATPNTSTTMLSSTWSKNSNSIRVQSSTIYSPALPEKNHLPLIFSMMPLHAKLWFRSTMSKKLTKWSSKSTSKESHTLSKNCLSLISASRSKSKEKPMASYSITINPD